MESKAAWTAAFLCRAACTLSVRGGPSTIHCRFRLFCHCMCIFVCACIPCYACEYTYVRTYLHTYNMHATLHTCMHAWEVVFRRAYSCVIGAYIRRYSIGTHMYRYMIHVYTVLRFDEVRLCIAAPFSTESCSCYSASAFQWVPKSPCRWC